MMCCSNRCGAIAIPRYPFGERARQRLRAKVEKDPEKPQVVLTVRGVGYKAGTAVTVSHA